MNTFPAFAPRAPWWGGDLQTLRNVLRPPPPGGGGEVLTFPMNDASGDSLLGRLQHPPAPRAWPLMLLIHGLTGCEDSAYMRAGAAFFLDHGHAVLLLNLRGAGPSRGACRERYHAGRTADLRRVIASLPEHLTAAGIVLMGYSLGANMMLKYLGEPGLAESICAAVSVSAPIDLAATWRQFARPRNILYHRWLLARMKEETLTPAIDLDPAARAAVAAARTIRGFDDVYVAPCNGFADADDYYARCSALGFLDRITTPTLLVHAEDDPWIPAAPYRSAACRDAAACKVLLSAGGGHVGFHGRGSTAAWHNRCAAHFVDSVTGGVLAPSPVQQALPSNSSR